MSRSLGLILVFMLLGGCATRTAFIRANRTHLSDLSYGMSKEQVHAVMGRTVVKGVNNPYRTSMSMTPEGVAVEVFYYWTDIVPGGPVDQALTPVVFNNESVVGWGREFWYDYAKKYELTVQQR